MIKPSWPAVFALKFLQKSMMLTPCGPSAVPTGGAGVAAPAGHCSFTIALIFLAISSPVSSARQGDSHNDPCGSGVLLIPSVARDLIRWSPSAASWILRFAQDDIPVLMTS